VLSEGGEVTKTAGAGAQSEDLLARIAWTTALDRRAGRAMFSGAEHPVGEGALAHMADRSMAADEQVAQGQMQQILERLVAGLPEDLRRPLELSTVQELNSVEIAEIMNIPENSVRTRLLRARKMLKEKLAALEVTENA
jgi:RNA polymerase sigma-70 factor, ECF subfamily